jgi:hypothetical protein
VATENYNRGPESETDSRSAAHVRWKCTRKCTDLVLFLVVIYSAATCAAVALSLGFSSQASSTISFTVSRISTSAREDEVKQLLKGFSELTSLTVVRRYREALGHRSYAK